MDIAERTVGAVLDTLNIMLGTEVPRLVREAVADSERRARLDFHRGAYCVLDEPDDLCDLGYEPDLLAEVCVAMRGKTSAVLVIMEHADPLAADPLASDPSAADPLASDPSAADSGSAECSTPLMLPTTKGGWAREARRVSAHLHALPSEYRDLEAGVMRVLARVPGGDDTRVLVDYRGDDATAMPSEVAGLLKCAKIRLFNAAAAADDTAADTAPFLHACYDPWGIDADSYTSFRLDVAAGGQRVDMYYDQIVRLMSTCLPISRPVKLTLLDLTEPLPPGDAADIERFRSAVMAVAMAVPGAIDTQLRQFERMYRTFCQWYRRLPSYIRYRLPFSVRPLTDATFLMFDIL